MGRKPAERKLCGHTNAVLGFKAPRVSTSFEPSRSTEVKGSMECTSSPPSTFVQLNINHLQRKSSLYVAQPWASTMSFN